VIFPGITAIKRFVIGVAAALQTPHGNTPLVVEEMNIRGSEISSTCKG
jgi:hypothetical protein